MSFNRHHIVLVGYRGAGKTTVGRILARRMKRPFIDTDREVERTAGMSVARIFREKGERAFRDMESGQIARLARRKPSVVAVGGGALDRATNRRALRRIGFPVWLDVPRTIFIHRLDSRGGARPLLKGRSFREEARLLFPKRGIFYRDVAKLRMQSRGASAERLAVRILRQLARNKGWLSYQ